MDLRPCPKVTYALDISVQAMRFSLPFCCQYMCLAGAVANVSDSDRCCNPKVPSSNPTALTARTFLEQESLIT